MTTAMRRLTVATLGLCLGLTATLAAADDRPYTEGPVVNVAGIRTEYGHFDDYLRFLATTWKSTMEAEKKAGLILSYEVLTVEARGPDDPDIYLVVTFKNWAALDGLDAKLDALEAQQYGSHEKADQAAVDRGKIRRNLGSQTMQVLTLK